MGAIQATGEILKFMKTAPTVKERRRAEVRRGRRKRVVVVVVVVVVVILIELGQHKDC